MSTARIHLTPEDHVQGDSHAECTLIEYGDYECPDCGRAYSIVKQVQKHFGTRLSFAYRNFPLNQIHPYAEAAAECAEFAGARGKFWEMHDLLFENQNRLSDALFEELVAQAGLSPVELREAFQTREYLPRIRADFTSGVHAGVNGTPSFFVNGRRKDNGNDYERLVEAIEEALAHFTR